MTGAMVQYGLLIALAIALVVAAFTDLRRRQIDNWLNAGIALVAPAFWWASDKPLAHQNAGAASAIPALSQLSI